MRLIVIRLLENDALRFNLTPVLGRLELLYMLLLLIELLALRTKGPLHSCYIIVPHIIRFEFVT